MKFLFSPKGWISTFLLIFIISSFSNAQITIEEKVEIDPQPIQSFNPTQTHTIQLDVQWDTPQYDASIVGVVVPCQSANADWQSGGSISLTINDAMAGFYRLQPRFNTPSGVTTNVTYQLYFDGSLVIEGAEVVTGGFFGGAFPHFNIEYTPPLVSNYLFYLDNDVSCILTPTPVNITPSNNCSTGVSWNNTDPLTLTIISGSEFASFYDVNQQMIGDNFSGTFSEFQDINIIQDSVYRGIEDKYFIVQSEWGGILKTDSVKLRTQTGDVIVVEPYGADDTLYTGENVSIDIYPNDFGGECIIFFPFEATYSAEIIKGNEYGNLLEPYTGIPVQSFTGLGHWFGMSGFNYVADGISPDVVDTVIIRVSTSDPMIPSTDLLLLIKPPPIYVYTEPEILAASDTADVIIKKRNADGTLEDFPIGQTFELAVTKGCVDGNILVGDSVGVYFADVQQPIKFVTADSLESDSGYVRLRVGTDVSAFTSPVGNRKGEEEKQLTERSRRIDTLRAGFEKMMDEKKAERLTIKNKTGEDPPVEAPIIGACYFGGSSHPVYWEGDVKYEGRGCGEWECEQNFSPFDGTIGIKDKFADYNDYNLCRYWSIIQGVGGFFPLFDKSEWYLGNGQFTEIKDQLIVPYQLDACYNTNDEYWQFSVLEDSLAFRAIIDVCESNIGYEYIIRNLQELSIIPNENTCLALEDFEKQREYAPVAATYYIYEMAWAHEKVHKNDFNALIKKVLNFRVQYNNDTRTFKEWLTTAYQPECNELGNTKSKAIYQAKKFYDEILQKFIKRLKRKWDDFTYKGNELAHRKYEEDTQADPMVQWKITQYKKELQKRPGEYWENCEFKEETE